MKRKFVFMGSKGYEEKVRFYGEYKDVKRKFVFMGSKGCAEKGRFYGGWRMFYLFWIPS